MRDPIEVTGRTRCVPGRKGVIAPVTLDVVVAVRVAPGDRVRKDQELVRLDDGTPQADMRAKQAALESLQIIRKGVDDYLESLGAASESGAIPPATYHAARTAALTAARDERIAQAALESAQATLEGYVVTAPIDGVVSWLDVHPGMVSRPGTTLWGEILDLSEIDVCCDLSPDQADRVAVGQAAEVRVPGIQETGAAGRVVFVGIAADRSSGLVPVLVRLPNPDGRWRCEVPVQVRFPEATRAGGAA